MTSVRAAVLNPGLFLGGKPHAVNFNCTLTLLDMPIPLMDVQGVLIDWVTTAFGYQSMCSSTEDCALWLELTLDAITTLSLFNDDTSPINIEPNRLIGCVVEGAKVSIGILIALAIVGFVLLIVLLGLVYELWAARKMSKQPTALLPFDLSDWQLATYRQTTGRSDPTLRGLRDVFLRYDSSRKMFRMTSYRSNVGECFCRDLSPSRRHWRG